MRRDAPQYRPGARRRVPRAHRVTTATIAGPGRAPARREARPARWSVDAVEALFALPFADSVRAQEVHREHHAPNAVQLSTLLSIKTGGCPEDCGYCPQAARHHTGVENEAMLDVAAVVAAAQAAKEDGASRFCMGAAWRGPKQRDLDPVLDMVREVKALGLETCCTLGMLKDGQAEQLRDAGLDYYNHNLDTAPEFYGEIVTTRDYQDRLDTLERVRGAGINVCCGGIVGMGESRRERAGLIAQLANLDPHPESVPINYLVQVEGTPLHERLQRRGGARPARVRAHDRRRAHHHAEGFGPPLGRPPRDGRGGAGAVLPRRRQFDFLRRQAADHRQSRRRTPIARCSRSWASRRCLPPARSDRGDGADRRARRRARRAPSRRTRSAAAHAASPQGPRVIGRRRESRVRQQRLSGARQ